MAVGHTEELDGASAASDLLEQCASSLDGETPRAGLFFAAHDLDIEDALAAIAAVHPDLELIGCTTLGAMSSSGGFQPGSTTLTLFASDVLDFTVGLGRDVMEDPGLAVRTAVGEAVSKTSKEPALVVVTPTVEHLDPTPMTRSMGEAIGLSVPVIGAGASPDFPVAMPWLGGVQFHGQEVLSDSLPLLVISGPLHVSIGIAHGWKPVGKEAVVTGAHENTVYEIDGEPILGFYNRYLGAGSQPAVANPLAVLDQETDRYFLRAPLEYNEDDGSAVFFGSIPQGSTVRLAMATTEEILEGADNSVAQALDGFPAGSTPEAALIASCAVRNLLLGTRTGVEIERILSGLDCEIPVSGFYGIGEIAPLGSDSTPSFHNETCVTVLIGT
ncbi:MAG: FIST signal transduction protein [Acidimicrobiia bacterium]